MWYEMVKSQVHGPSKYRLNNVLEKSEAEVISQWSWLLSGLRAVGFTQRKGGGC